MGPFAMGILVGVFGLLASSTAVVTIFVFLSLKGDTTRTAARRSMASKIEMLVGIDEVI